MANEPAPAVVQATAERLAADYAHFPDNQTYSLYAETVVFQDPLNRVQGRQHFADMVGFLARWFRNLRLELHDLSINEAQIRTEWTMSWVAPLPWQPPIAVSGWSELTVNAEGLIQAQVDYWHCSRWQLLQQHLPGYRP